MKPRAQQRRKVVNNQEAAGNERASNRSTTINGSRLGLSKQNRAKAWEHPRLSMGKSRNAPTILGTNGKPSLTNIAELTPSNIQIRFSRARCQSGIYQHKINNYLWKRSINLCYKISSCGRYNKTFISDSEQSEPIAPYIRHCQNKFLCFKCEARRINNLRIGASSYISDGILASPSASLYFLTLTFNPFSTLDALRKKVDETFAAIRQRRRDARRGKAKSPFGAIERVFFTVEVAQCNTSGNWTAHLHGLALFSSPPVTRQIKEAWHSLTGAFEVNIQAQEHNQTKLQMI
ncbi:MAG: hypothetical protein ACKVS6_03090, partial [Planctomycetota bacterium]